MFSNGQSNAESMLRRQGFTGFKIEGPQGAKKIQFTTGFNLQSSRIFASDFDSKWWKKAVRLISDCRGSVHNTSLHHTSTVHYLHVTLPSGWGQVARRHSWLRSRQLDLVPAQRLSWMASTKMPHIVGRPGFHLPTKILFDPSWIFLIKYRQKKHWRIVTCKGLSSERFWFWKKTPAHSTQHHGPQQFQSFLPGCTLFAGIDGGAVSNHIP